MDKEIKEKLDILYNKMYKCEKCKICSLHVNLERGKLRGEGNNSDVMCVAQNPSINRKNNGVFLPGSRNNDLFIRMMEEIGWKRDDYFVTNLVKCSTENNELEDLYINNCSDWISKEIETLKPKIVIAIGSDAKKFFKVSRGFPRTDDKKILYIGVAHPAYCLRGGIDEESYKKQFLFIKQYLDNFKQIEVAQ